ncbi:GNAT family N-acetyltransferase [Streptomyces sp. NBC_00370]|uniref:GNAT family N-acetyltransferase n=1 Tax=Streptomyces sp. NBC_00370 TaxID=2975728 RepID=UPI002E271E3A
MCAADAGRQHPDASRLIQALRAEQLGLYGFADDPDTTPEADFDPPGLFLIAHFGEEAVGCGGVRGHGISGYLLERLERHAASRGASRMVLETGRRNTAALALYHRTGYVPCSSYVAARDPRVNRATTRCSRSVMPERYSLIRRVHPYEVQPGLRAVRPA